jgi:hypothetical protein
MPEINDTLSDAVSTSDSMTYEVTDFRYIYGSVAAADRYFSEKVDGEFWSVQSADKKNRALITATRAIDNLRFHGEPTDATQPLSFPRNGDTESPAGIQQATYEEAFALLKGTKPDTEYAGSFVTARVFGKVRTDYDARTTPDHVVNGIASHRAWLLLLPFMVRGAGVKLRRGD